MTNEDLVQLIKQGINISDNMAMLYSQNKGLIYSIIKRYRYVCKHEINCVSIIEMDELMHEAYFGLLKAVESYEPCHQVLFMSYAEYWIRQSVKRYLENCGQTIRVPVHKQQKIYNYNQATSYYLQHFNREPTTREYARCLQVSSKAIENLEKSMFLDHMKSLDAPLPGGEDGDIFIADMVASDIDIENDVVEKVAKEQINNELWNIVDEVLKEDKLKKIIKMRYIDKLTLKEIGVVCGVTIEQVRQYESKALKRLRCNTRTKKLGKELEIIKSDKSIIINGNELDTERIKRWIDNGYINILEKHEIDYAIRIGWMKG